MSADDPEKELLKIVNASGFPFQMAVKYCIDLTTRMHR